MAMPQRLSSIAYSRPSRLSLIHKHKTLYRTFVRKLPETYISWFWQYVSFCMEKNMKGQISGQLYVED